MTSHHISAIIPAMWNTNYDSISELDGILRSKGLAMSKKFGQNFLVSSAARERIASLIAPEPGMRIWEIGPGLGAITHLIIRSGADLTAFEIDHGFAEILRSDAFGDEECFHLVEGDALKTLFSESYVPDRIIGNLPYNVGSFMIARIIENGIIPSRMVITLQKEVVDRMCASPGDDDYSSFSVLTQIDYGNRNALLLKRGCVWPQPQVDSAVVVMEKRKQSLVPDDLRPLFIPLVRALFSMRRKTIRNNLSSQRQIAIPVKADAVFEAAGLSGNERAETLSIEKLLHIAEAVYGLTGGMPEIRS